MMENLFILNRFELSPLKTGIQDSKGTPFSFIFARGKEGNHRQSRYLEIELNNYSNNYKNYNIEKYIVNIIGKLPEEDLTGLDKINIYDDSYPKTRTGLYYPPSIISKGAQIDIYLEQSLGYMNLIRSKIGLLNQISNKIFLIFFGRLFLAENLLHEIGHHKHIAILNKQYETSEAQEEDADSYSMAYYRELHPLISKYYIYRILNRFYHLLFKRRIERSNRLISERGICDPEYSFRKGILHLKEGDYKKAIEGFNKVIKLDSSNHYAYANRARAKYSLGIYEGAIEDMARVIDLHPDYLAEAYYYRGWYYQSIDAWGKAIGDYKTAIELDCSDEGIYLNRAYCYMQLHDYEKVKEDLLEAIKRGINESEIPPDLKKMID